MSFAVETVTFYRRGPEARQNKPKKEFRREVLDPNGEAFLIPYADGYILYVPRAGIIALLEAALADAVRRKYRGEPIHEDYGLEIAALESRGAFAIASLTTANRTVAAERWKPTSVTFSTTQKCTLRCTYCYAEGGRLDDLDLPWDIAKAAIDMIVDNAIEVGERPSINFLGEGEATAAWKVFRRCIDYLNAKCEASGTEAFVALSTNGVYPINRTDYLAKHCHSITFSLDGIGKVHDKNRVLPNGKGSFDLVIRNMKALQATGRSFNIRSTADSESLDQMSSFVAFVGEELDCKTIHIEPVFDVTPLTSLGGTIEHPQGEVFISAFRKARQIAAGYGIDLYYSAADLNVKDSFCGASDGRNFLVTARGIVTSCNEVLQPNDPRAELFQYGQWSKTTKSFEIQKERVNRLADLRTPKMSKCTTCIAKYNCAGDCYARSAGLNGSPWSDKYTYRCEITRELLVDNLILNLLGSAASPEPLFSSTASNCSF